MGMMNYPQKSDGASAGGARSSFDPEAAKAEWSGRTKATVRSTTEFLGRKTREGLVVVGVTGFIDEWSGKRITQDVSCRADMRSAEARLEWDLQQLKDQFGEKLVVATHGVSKGLPVLVQQICKRLSIESVGVTSAQSFKSKPPAVDSIVVGGEHIADESKPLVHISDKLLVLGGSEIAKREALEFQQTSPDAWKSLYIYTTFGGAAGDLRASQIHAMFVMS
jgi:hypothetical protein